MPQENVVDQVFVEEFRGDAKLAYQQMGTLLRKSVQTQDDVTGLSTTFYKFGKVAEPKPKTRGGDIAIDDADQEGVECTLQDRATGIYRDSLDLLKVSTDQKMLAAKSLAAAFGRLTDKQIITKMADTAISVGDYTTAFSEELVDQATEKLYDNEVPDDGQWFAALTGRAWNQFKSFSKVSSSDHAGQLYPWLKGKQSFIWNGIVWMTHSGLPASGNNRDCFLWHKAAVGHASGQEVKVDIDWIPTKRSWLIGGDFSQGACLVDGGTDGGVVKIKVSNVAAPA